jgi:zinc D-Ala-D-Ala carboxypeptidase
MRFTRLAAASALGLALFTAPVSPASAAVSSLCGYTSSQPTLSSGSSGTAVRQAQCELNWAYQNQHGALSVDGSFGTATKNATINFQRCVHLSADGVIGPDTWTQLNYWVNQPGYACG